MKTKHIFILQGLVRCGSCGSYMTPKYSTGRNKLHFYYQCTKNSHFGKKECDMRYVPAAELERVVLERLKELSVDENTIKQIVEKANGLSGEEIQKLESQIIGLENQAKPIDSQIRNLVDGLAQGLKVTESVIERLKELEEQKKQFETQISRLRLDLKQMKQKRLDAQTMRDSLIHFSQILESATPEEQKALVYCHPRIVESITFTPTEIEIALFDQMIERGLLYPPPTVNHSSNGALEMTRWLPETRATPKLFTLTKHTKLVQRGRWRKWIVDAD